MAKTVKKRLKLKNPTLLADKGYYNGEDLRRCQRNKIVAIVAKPKEGREVPNSEYALDKSKYDVHHDSYRCLEGKLLPRTGTKASKLYGGCFLLRTIKKVRGEVALLPLFFPRFATLQAILEF